ncbi:LysR family transcriptional regulator [Stakelama saccharophila]|uniref:LysR family transcriptional regulator n=1 Tax=Stakelama saccharophila TaxID=3075605 RepID=A0ABZ0BBC0_9SPHN|nr:LysR family transcriptional regulator [Stakelama sp. W311]WNO54497.1 LysR family transcriptional regulator [Stakelama sp. W311]
MIETDLNLLRVFDTLYEERSVTRASERLGLTQSAVSHALRRLRDMLDDPLFVRAARGLQPTPRAIEIAPGVRTGLDQLRSALAPSQFDPAIAERGFTLAAGSYFCALLVPKLVARTRVTAPGISFRIVPQGAQLLSELDESVVDLALGAFSRVPPRLTAQPLYREELVWIAAAGHPLSAGPVSTEALEAQPRLRIAPARPFEALRSAGPQGDLERHAIAESDAAGRTPAATVYDALTAIATVARTDQIALVPERFVRDRGHEAIAVLDAPGQAHGIELSMLWHSKFDADAGLTWLRETIVDILR